MAAANGSAIHGSATTSASRQSMSAPPRWSPTPAIFYAVVVQAFVPAREQQLHRRNRSGESEEDEGDALFSVEDIAADADLEVHDESEAFQLSLEIGDECYVFEQYGLSVPGHAHDNSKQRPPSWYRGYVVSNSPRPVIPTASSDSYGLSDASGSRATPSLALDTQVSIGIFPAACVEVREQLDDYERRLSTLPQPTSDLAKLSAASSTPGMSPLEPLREEDDQEQIANGDRTPNGHTPLSPASSRRDTRLRSRASVLSISDYITALAAMDKNGASLRLSKVFTGAGVSGDEQTPPSSGKDKPAPPVPNLKCGDETAYGSHEPLVDEIACAIREWSSLLYTYLHRRDYKLFTAVKQHIDDISVGRRQLLSGSLSKDEHDRLARALTARLVQGNREQGLDVIVRHPQTGSLVDVDSAEDGEAWLSAISMYSNQVALAYGSPPSAASPQVPPNHRLSTSAQDVDVAFYHVFLDLRSFSATICSAGETSELYFALYNKTTTRYVTEEFCVIVDHTGAPLRGDEAARTLFRDLSQNDVQDQIFLVCRIVKNGGLKLAPTANGSTLDVTSQRPAPSSASQISLDSTSALQSRSSTDLGSSSSMLAVSRGGRQSVRRPFGYAVLEIGQFKNDEGESSKEHMMPIFCSVDEGAFCTLHEAIIGSRIRELERSPHAEAVYVTVRILYGQATTLRGSTLPLETSLTNRLGFPDVVFPGDERNDVYVKLWSGNFWPTAGSGGGKPGVRGLANIAAAAGGGRNIEVDVEVRTNEGSSLDSAISRGAGEPNVAQFASMVFRSSNDPTWGELFKLDVAPDVLSRCHLFFTFRARLAANRNSVGGAGATDRPFAFAYFPLFHGGNMAFAADGAHSLVLYKYETHVAMPQFYFQAPPLAYNGDVPPLPPSISKTLFPLRDYFEIRTFLVSTRFTQNETLLKILQWEKVLAANREQLRDTLGKLRFCSEEEIVKFLRDIFDALFAILASPDNSAGDVDDVVFEAIVTILSIVSDRRFQNFKPVVELYIDQHMTCSTATPHLLRSLQRLLRSPSDPANAQTLRTTLKVLRFVFKLVIRSRQIQRLRAGVGMDVTSEHVEAAFKRDLHSLLGQINMLMSMTSPTSIIGLQIFAVQNFASIIPELRKVFGIDALADIAVAFGDAIVASQGKITIWKLLYYNQLVNSVVFETPAGRATLVPTLVRWLKPNLGKFDELALGVKDTEAVKDNARVRWLEGLRLAFGVIASALDVLHHALVDSAIASNRNLIGQEQDNIEYLLSLLPRLVESARELESPRNLEAVERQRSTASFVPSTPPVFVSSYPFSLLSVPPEQRQRHQAAEPSFVAGLGELAAIFVALVLLAPKKVLVNYFESMLEVEGKDNFARTLTAVFRFAKGVLENEAYPPDWLNINVLAHRMCLKLVEPLADLLEDAFVPAQSESFAFNTSLWRDFFALLLRLLSSPQLAIEDFSPQKRRAVWRLTGDIRLEGAQILSKLWSAIGWPEDRVKRIGVLSRYGGYQVQFVPVLVEPCLSICLSRHDELRSAGVTMLFSMIVSEYYLNDNFAVIETEVIDRLDRMLMVQGAKDDVAQTHFVGQLRVLFEEANIEDRLREQVGVFLSSIDTFLDLLVGVRGLPDGDEFQEDRIVSTLRLMDFIKGIGRSEVFVRYINRLVSYHVATGHEAEAGLTLKLHADLYEWDTKTVVDEIVELTLPQHTAFRRKELLYGRMIEHLRAGQMWEVALSFCRELQQQYETKTYEYTKLANVMSVQGTLFGSIADGGRRFGDCYRVALYGSGFPAPVSNKQFIYRANEGELMSAFIERMMNKHPAAHLIKTSALPTDDVRFGEGQHIQITAVQPEIELELLQNEEVPASVRAYYEQNEATKYVFTRPIQKDSEGRSLASNDFTSMWTEKTVLICEDSFPTILRRIEIVEIQISEVSPIENAIASVDKQARELGILEKQHRNGGGTHTNMLALALDRACDPPSNTGTPMYKASFLTPHFVATNPDKAHYVEQLEGALTNLATAVARCLRLHASVCGPEMRSYHDTLHKLFERNFGDEIARMPDQELVAELRAPVDSLLGDPDLPASPLRSPSLDTPPAPRRAGSVRWGNDARVMSIASTLSADSSLAVAPGAGRLGGGMPALAEDEDGTATLNGLDYTTGSPSSLRVRGAKSPSIRSGSIKSSVMGSIRRKLA